MSESTGDPRFYLLRQVSWGDLESAERLVTADPSIVEARNSIGETALHFLVVENAIRAVEFLRSKESRIDTVNEFGNTPLVEAAGLGYLKMCQYLVSHGANFRHISPVSGESAYSRAASSEKTETLVYLLSLLAPSEDLNPLFCDVDAELIFGHHEAAAQLLRARGLTKRWPDE